MGMMWKDYGDVWSQSLMNFPDSFLGIGFLIALGILMVLIAVAIYIYFALSLMTIGKKLRYKKSWLAWIPVANISMILQMGKFHWAWVFLILIPIAGWIALFVLFIISMWRIFERRKYPGWFSLSLILPYFGGILYLVAMGFAAWSDRKTRLRL